VVPIKRTIVAATVALTAILPLTGCANGVNGYGVVTGDAAGAGSGSDAAALPAAAKPAGNLTTTLISKTVPRMGTVVTDSKGWILYRFDKDKANPSTSNCVGTCAKVWPPVLTDGIPKLKGVDPTEVGTLLRDDGGMQVTIGGWPVYRYIGDKKPGRWKGQNVTGTWFVVSKDGTKNLTCVPPISKAVKPPANTAPAADAAAPAPTATGDSGTSDDSGGYSSSY
jgi:predicted lipoprotein with Yx(FWY)xxD motif